LGYNRRGGKYSLASKRARISHRIAEAHVGSAFAGYLLLILINVTTEGARLTGDIRRNISERSGDARKSTYNTSGPGLQTTDSGSAKPRLFRRRGVLSVVQVGQDAH
jgi:hypothetical protein